jgi:hypothetical protein
LSGSCDAARHGLAASRKKIARSDGCAGREHDPVVAVHETVPLKAGHAISQARATPTELPLQVSRVPGNPRFVGEQTIERALIVERF